MDKILDTRTREFSVDCDRLKEEVSGQVVTYKGYKGRSAFCML